MHIPQRSPWTMIKALLSLLCTLTLFASQHAHAQNSKSVFLEELTWTELQTHIRSGKKTIIIPIGGTEQSGPHMALGKHNVRVRFISEKIARNLGNALVAPVVAYVPEGQINPPTQHMKFPGTITIPEPIFEKLLESAAGSFKQHGFTDIIFLGDHGGYQANLRTVAERLNRDWKTTPARAHAIADYYRVTQNEYVQALKARGYGDEEIGTHAGLADTSLMLAVEPGMVRTEQLRSSAPGKNDGISGAARRSSAELGQLGIDAIVTKTVVAIKKSVVR